VDFFFRFVIIGINFHAVISVWRSVIHLRLTAKTQRSQRVILFLLSAETAESKTTSWAIRFHTWPLCAELLSCQPLTGKIKISSLGVLRVSAVISGLKLVALGQTEAHTSVEKSWIMRKNIYLFAALIPFLISGCASWSAGRAPDFSNSEETVTTPPQSGWWYARFQMEWPENEDPMWQTDLFLAHKVLSPMIAQHQETIGLWRFHRRALRDQAGHQFTFIFYASPQVASQVFNQVNADPFLEEMKAGGILAQAHFDDTNFVARPRLEDTSDRRWSLPVQRSWPYYIMGVSEMWLHMIQETVELNPSEVKPQSLQDYLAFYKKVEESITEAWKREGRHAYLHHLNAMFGYEPLRGSDGSEMKF